MNVEILLLILVDIIVPVTALISIAFHSRAAFTAAGSSKTMWILFIVLLFIVPGASLLLSIIYLVWVRRKVRAAEKSGAIVKSL